MRLVQRRLLVLNRSVDGGGTKTRCETLSRSQVTYAWVIGTPLVHVLRLDVDVLLFVLIAYNSHDGRRVALCR